MKSMILRPAIVALAALGLAGCSSYDSGYGYSRVSVGYGNVYRPYYGWYDGYYYPGPAITSTTVPAPATAGATAIGAIGKHGDLRADIARTGAATAATGARGARTGARTRANGAGTGAKMRANGAGIDARIVATDVDRAASPAVTFRRRAGGAGSLRRSRSG